MENLSDAYLMAIVDKLDGIGEVPWLNQKAMARELLESRVMLNALLPGHKELFARLEAAEKVVKLLDDTIVSPDRHPTVWLALMTYDKVKNSTP